MKVIFIFAHYDDEFPVINMLSTLIDKASVHFIYVTTDQQHMGKRREENETVLSALGYSKKNIHHMSDYGLVVPDGELYECILPLRTILNSEFFLEESVVFTSAFEWGHQDHDALALLLHGMYRDNLISALYYIPTYSPIPNPFKFPIFDVMSYPGPGVEIIRRRLTLLGALSNIMAIMKYKSQFRTWLGLLPIYIIKILIRRYEVYYSPEKQGLPRNLSDISEALFVTRRKICGPEIRSYIEKLELLCKD